MLTKEGHFSREENEKVTELTEKGNRTESSILFLSLVMGKGSRVRRAMWECFVTWRTELPKLDRILREIQELGPDPQEYMNIAQGLSELPTQLIDVQQKHKETLREQTETLRVNTILMREKVKVFQLVDRYAELTVISTVRDRTLVEHELLARGRDHEEWTEKHLRQDGGDTEPQYTCTDPEFKCKVSDIVYSLIQGKLLPGCSVLVTTRPTALHLLEKAEIRIWAEILGFVGEERKEYFFRHFKDQMVAAAVFQHVKENEILYTMSYNPSYCWILALALGPFFTQRVRDPQRVPKTITQLYSYYIYNILKNHGREIENPRDVLLRVGQMAFRGVSERKIVFTDGDLIKYNLQPSQFLSGFLMELLEREDSAQSVVYTFPHLTIQEFAAAVAQEFKMRLHTGLRLDNVGLTYSAAEDLASALSTNRSLTELDLSHNKLGDSGVKLVSAALRNSECKIQKLWLRDVGLTDSGAEDLVSALRINPSLTWINLGTNSLTDRSVPALRRLILTLPSPELIRLDGNQFSENGRKELGSLQVPRPGLRVICEQLNE
ncbi:NACHT, LRR and PYD domains-containing protein 3-like [Hypanus sabinus]|uniref:NACHT, LRR and PYD domains-containing protein 3-like n=1 Tax=Hypanus sabinus TaxID=79690 RepID=UPI0028C3EC3F|nr:NACHT, LRR and PYD domains-containing protein 3-like [Hypanus sabinus]